MRARDFCYWVQGYFEIMDASRTEESLSPAQVQTIKNHLAMVFKHEIDPLKWNTRTQPGISKTTYTRAITIS